MLVVKTRRTVRIKQNPTLTPGLMPDEGIYTKSSINEGYLTLLFCFSVHSDLSSDSMRLSP